METERSKRTVQALLDDAIRLGGVLSQPHIERVLDRRKLEPAETLSVYKALEDNGIIALSDDDAELGESGDSETETESEDNTSGDAEDVPESDDLNSEQDVPEPKPDALKKISDDFRSHSLLTSDEEVELGRAVSLSQKMQKALADGAVEKTVNVIEILERGRQSKEKIIRSNLRLVLKIAFPFSHLTTLELDDIVQEGVLGLIRAVEKFDHTKGFRFSTYAFWWIRQSIMRSLADKGDTIRIPVHMKENILRLKRAVRVLRRLNGDRYPHVSELANELHWPKEKIQFVIELSQTLHLSTEAQPGKDDDLSFINTIADMSPGPEELYSLAEVRNHIQEVLETLPLREQDIIKKRFGIEQNDEWTLEEIGQLYGLTRERIRQLEAKALIKLRHPSRLDVIHGLLN